MPDRPLHPHGPRWSRHRLRAVEVIYKYPFELGLSLVLVLLGARSILFPDPDILAMQPTLVTYGFWALALIGGALTLAGLVTTRGAPGIEQAGLYLSGAAWASYLLRQVETVGTARGGLLLAAILVLAVASVVRARAITREERAKLVALVARNINGGDTDE